MKKLISVLLSMLLVATVCVGGAFCVTAAEDEYGTFENGILPTVGDTKITPTDKFYNGDFQDGLRYWTTRGTKKAPSESVKLITEGDNTYIQFTPSAEYDGIISPYFLVEGARVGMNLSVFFKWRGEGAMQIFIEHQNGTEPSTRVSNGAPKLLKEATDENGWNLSMSGVSNPIMELKDGIIDETHRFKIGVQITNDLETNIQVDDLQLCIYRKDTNKLYALDGTTVVADIAALEKEMLEEDSSDDDSTDNGDFDFDFGDGTDTDTDTGSDTDNDMEFDNTDGNTDNNTDAEEEDKGSFVGSVWFWVIIGAVVVVIAAGVVFFILKKKKAVPAVDETSAEE